MTRKINLSVNDKPIKLDYFVAGYVDHVTGGIIASLKDTGEIKTLELTIDNEGQVKINLNGADVPLKLLPGGNYPEHPGRHGRDALKGVD